jgi:hypothetical protein
LNDQQLVATAKAADAALFKKEFVSFAMPADFLDELNDLIKDFDTALSNQQTGIGHQVIATAAFDDLMAAVLSDVRQLDAIVRNTFHDDPARLAAWLTARHVERPPRKKKEAGKPEKQ